MVGVGPKGAESSLARVSLVNYYAPCNWTICAATGEGSGAKTFEEVQKCVAELLKDRILVGHAAHNDFKALLLSHPRPSTYDTQFYARKHKLSRSNRVTLRKLIMPTFPSTLAHTRTPASSRRLGTRLTLHICINTTTNSLTTPREKGGNPHT
ncbi:hypothetical protein BD779DRAFT_279912 [Infundibulicybe gibba]|nr:hypothetical protein BD779DRAFT_279912 [Infundibulicybe gibba]